MTKIAYSFLFLAASLNISATTPAHKHHHHEHDNPPCNHESLEDARNSEHHGH